MEIIFLGTSSGKVSLSRSFSSILLKIDNDNYLIDAGDGISKQLLNLNIGFEEIDAILFSHYHADHFGGIASLITQMKLINRVEKLVIYTRHELIDSLVKCLNTCYLFLENLGFECKIVGFKSMETMKLTRGVSFTGIQNNHLLNKYDVLTTMPFISSSFFFELNGISVCYSSDIGSIEDLYRFENGKCDVLISEARHVKYTELKDAFERIKPKYMYLTHYDDDSYDELKKEFDEPNIFIAKDGMKVKL